MSKHDELVELAKRLRSHSQQSIQFGEESTAIEDDCAEAADALEALAKREPVAWQEQWPLGVRVTKKSGSSWTGKIVGYYSTELTPEGVCIESETETGSVQIYPTKAVRPFTSERQNER